MASLIPGYEYDIFISYRQKDNKYDGWVTDFVDNLKRELEATFKEEISVYFDINPHDGLLETHDVDASLKEKLKCLVFIPIISRTYCDPKSFAWDHEFKAFIEQASSDKFGLKIKLPGGNVANRILPVRIHDLDNEDIELCESIIGGVLRGVEFIYKEPGVNRSLTSKDDERKNLNGTLYRNQINKVALAIKEIISGLKKETVLPVKENAEQRESSGEFSTEEKQKKREKHSKLNIGRLLSGAAILVIIIVAAILAYPEIFKHDKLKNLRSSDGRISVAVMPFMNMTNDTAWNDWQDGIQINLISSLSNSRELKVRHTESIKNLIRNEGFTNYASITPTAAGTISQKLDASIFIYGNINKTGSTIRLNAQLIDSKTEEVIKSFQIDGIAENILPVIDSLSHIIKDFLIISTLKKEVSHQLQIAGSTNSPEAFRYFTYGINAFAKSDYTTARNMYLHALAIDSNLITAALYISISYSNQGLYDQAKKWCLKIYDKRDKMSMIDMLFTEWCHALLFETPDQEIFFLRQIGMIDDQIPVIYYLLGLKYNELQQYDKAISEFEKELGIYNKWGSKPVWSADYYELGYAYHKTGQYDKEKMIYKKAEKDFPGHFFSLQKAVLSLVEEDTIATNGYIEEALSSFDKNSSTFERSKVLTLAGIYSEAGLLDKAEEFYRKAQSLALKSSNIDFAWFLIDKDRNVNEGLELTDRALKSNPDNYSYLDYKGWGLYKLGKYKEALDILQKSWDLRRKNAIYDHEAFLRLEEARKAVAGRK